MAGKSCPMRASAIVRFRAMACIGVMSPYPSVVRVVMLKY